MYRPLLMPYTAGVAKIYQELINYYVELINYYVHYHNMYILLLLC